MTPEARQRRLQSLAREARGRTVRLADELERRKDLPAATGDLFVLPATAELPVEWAILDRNPGSGELLAVPADYHPLAGSADVAVEPEGSLVLRCRFGVWLPPALFKIELRTGVLADEIVTAARHRWRQLEQGEVTASPLAEEVDVDPEYRDWIRDVPERARSLAFRTRSGGMKPASSWALRLAATLAVVALGLAVWVVRLRQELARIPEPELSATSADLHLGDGLRGVTELVVPPEEKMVVLHLLVEPRLGLREGFVELVDRENHVLYRSRRLPLSGELNWPIPRQRLPDGLYSVRLYAEGSTRPVATQRLRVETSE